MKRHSEAVSPHGDASKKTPLSSGSLFVHDTRRALFLVLSIGLNLLLWGLVAFFLGTGHETVVLRYNAYFGIDLTGRAQQAFLLPASALFFLMLHGVLAFSFFRKGETIAALLLLLSAFLLQGAALIAVSALILVN
ncbi:MAG: hypothetical protein IPL87_03915 [Candidatus Moraniibacteriota bacterium]|nr:MAG: hypothetical protein IPL87_03915 [Candidatus Moranbacteria bacterium]